MSGACGHDHEHDHHDDGPLERPDSPWVNGLAPSPNHDERRAPVDILMMHYTGMQDGMAALHRLCDPNPPRVSAHYVVFEDGEIVQCVAEGRRAWHAGAGSWQGREDVNSRSIGIEIVNPGHEFGYRPFPEEQVAAVVNLSRDILMRHPQIAPAGVLAHSDTAPGRKQDPGELFPWGRLAEEGVGLWVPPAPLQPGPVYRRGEEGPPIQAVQALFAMAGYGLQVTGVFDGPTEAVVTAFQRHWRQEKVDGVADASTLRTLRDLLAAR
ncbi:peptidoglycan recognition protein family protein [Phreatobacter cathodiphilus]|uniref:N-acetylmuramoyl-L-alanine amidase n=1 Tax=Phreatobacter cathodiphilus TaxID=1868589 RepID=A0A2S0N6A1_9HYPH|nr:N-acetylmuramoyl-L-alanine amidase [Phreatobacter cathodiphilus]AVO43679.1 N-acetylmuramoyl-L-alanine amidase [Phreatobacter cathodiphilus]